MGDIFIVVGCVLPFLFLLSVMLGDWLACTLALRVYPHSALSRFTDARYAGAGKLKNPIHHSTIANQAHSRFTMSCLQMASFQPKRLVGIIHASLPLKVDIYEPTLP